MRYHVGFEEGKPPAVWKNIHDVPAYRDIKLWTVEAETPDQAIERASMLRWSHAYRKRLSSRRINY